LFFEFLAQTGLRIGEAIELRWEDVDGSWLRVDRRFYRGAIGLPKGRKCRRVPLSRELAQALWRRRGQLHAAPGDLVFTSERGMRLDPHNLASRVLKPAGRTAGVGEWIGFHTFRHTCATMLFRRGWNAVQVQKFLGHSDPGFTLRSYVHLLPEDLPEPNFAARLTAVHGEQGADGQRDERPSEMALGAR
jgi:integrase